jgi:hypothetical protein
VIVETSSFEAEQVCDADHVAAHIIQCWVDLLMLNDSFTNTRETIKPKHHWKQTMP